MSLAAGRRHRVCGARCTAAALLVLAFAVPASAQKSAIVNALSGQTAAPAPPQVVRPEPIPVADVAARAEETSARMRDLVTDLEGAANLGEIESGIVQVGGRIWTGVGDTQALLDQGPRLSVVNDLIEGWTVGRRRVSDRYEAVTVRVRQTTKALDEIKQQRELWTLTDEEARASDAPANVLARVAAVEADLDRAREGILKLRDHAFQLQDQVAKQLAVCDDVLDRLQRYRRATAGDVTRRSSPPLWEADMATHARRAAEETLLKDPSNELRIALRFVDDRIPVFVVAAALFAGVTLWLRTARARGARLAEEEPALAGDLRALSRPYSVALLLSMVVLLWISPGIPRLFGHVIAVASFVPVLRILREVAHPRLHRMLSALVFLLMVDRIREFVAISPLLEQLVLSLDMAAGLALVFYALRPSRLRGVTLTSRELFWARSLAWLLRVLAVSFAISLAAAVSGYMPLARTVALVPLTMIYGATAFYAAARGLIGIAALVSHSWPLASLRSVKLQPERIERETRRVIGWLAVASWGYMIYENLTAVGLTGAGFRHLAAVDLVPGNGALTVGDVAAFAVTVWASFLLSRFVRFVLGEEVFPRMQMAHGLPYALSSLVHYAILLAGFGFALSTLGLGASRLAVLVGALGVGVGFGLQAIVNNFVSGLILLFERPIQLGDTVQIGDVTGDVKRIGIRSSTVRTSTGAEVIVPNSSFISERVTNWTLSDRSRRFEIQVGMAYGTKPADALLLLTEVARKHPEVLAYPAPMSLFRGFGESSLDFELRAWVHDGDRVSIVRSEVAVAVMEALDAAGIAIPFPQREVRLLGGSDEKPPAAPRP